MKPSSKIFLMTAVTGFGGWVTDYNAVIMFAFGMLAFVLVVAVLGEVMFEHS